MAIGSNAAKLLDGAGIGNADTYYLRNSGRQ